MRFIVIWLLLILFSNGVIIFNIISNPSAEPAAWTPEYRLISVLTVEFAVAGVMFVFAGMIEGVCWVCMDWSEDE